MLNPDSYKYYLNVGESRSSRLPYIRAAAKRLNALGYYNQTEVGEEASYTEALAEAVTKFQVMHDLSNNGAICKVPILSFRGQPVIIRSGGDKRNPVLY